MATSSATCDGYMDKDEKKGWMASDPVPAFRAWLIANGHATEAELAAIEAAIDQEIDEAVEFALSSAVPDVAELRRDVFARGDVRMSAAANPKPMNTIEAINKALDDAMALDPNVILLGEDIADEEDGGVVGVTQGPVDEVRQGARALDADFGAGDHRRGDRRGDRRHAPGGRDHADELHDGRDGHDRQPRREAALHVGRADARAAW